MGGKYSTLQVDKEPFGEGATRWAYRARVRHGEYEGYPAGTELVLKVIKRECYERGIRLTTDDIEAQELTRKYCQLFNTRKYANKQVFSRSGKLISAAQDYYDVSGECAIARGDPVLLEQYIHGTWEKFNSNTGWALDSVSLPNFFSHWTWVQSGGRHLVCDLQGHRGRPGGPPYGLSHDYYLFTDPAVMTDSGGLRYGCSDLGALGIRKWFQLHKCNKLCIAYGLQSKRPTEFAQDTSAQSQPQTLRLPGLKDPELDIEDSMRWTKYIPQTRHPQ